MIVKILMLAEIKVEPTVSAEGAYIQAEEKLDRFREVVQPSKTWDITLYQPTRFEGAELMDKSMNGIDPADRVWLVETEGAEPGSRVQVIEGEKTRRLPVSGESVALDMREPVPEPGPDFAKIGAGLAFDREKIPFSEKISLERGFVGFAHLVAGLEVGDDNPSKATLNELILTARKLVGVPEPGPQPKPIDPRVRVGGRVTVVLKGGANQAHFTEQLEDTKQVIASVERARSKGLDLKRLDAMEQVAGLEALDLVKMIHAIE